MPNESAARDLVPGVLATWSVPSVFEALYAHERGEFFRSAMLCDHIWRDDRFFSTLQTRVLAVLGLPFRVDKSESTTNKQRAEALAIKVKGWWFDCIPEAVLGDVLRWVIPMGFAIGENVWGYDEDSGELRIVEHKIHHLQFVRWSEALKKFTLSTVDGMLEINPGDGRWVLWTSSASQRPWMMGAIRALAVPFLLRTFTRRDWARRSEIEGTGVKKAGVPDDAKDEDVAKFLRNVSKLGTDTTLKLPPGYTFEIEATDASAADGFGKLVAHCDTAITLTILGQNLTTQIEGGSFAAATVHARVQLDRIVSDVGMLATIARKQIVAWWGKYNIPGYKFEWTPWPKYDATPPEDLQKVAQSLLTLGQAATSLQALGLNLDPVFERFSLQKDPAGPPKPAATTVPVSAPGDPANQTPAQDPPVTETP